ncbi:FAD-dependent oxidoreductase, partial [Nocardia gipuzkoensis]
SGLRTDALGRLRTDEMLISIDDDHVIAAGDAAAPSDLPFRMGCQTAMQLGPQAAETVLRRIAGDRPAPLDVGYVGQCISLGRRAGMAQFAQRNDTATRFYLGGLPGATVKELVCRSILWEMAYEARHPGARTWWAKDDERRELLRAERGEALPAH